MNNQDKVAQLKELIEETLTPYINNDYVLYDLPYYSNIGDILIWQGELTFLKNLPFRCLDSADNTTCTFPRISTDTVILFQGGGNFGDLYPEHVQFLIELTKRYPQNRIVVFPQTVFYQHEKNLLNDCSALSNHKDLVICARDKRSFSTLKSQLSSTILLLPDMAFCIPQHELSKFKSNKVKKTLFMKRLDPEFKEVNLNCDPENVETRDWPTFEGKIFDGVFLGKCIGVISRKKLPLINRMVDKLWDFYAAKVYRKDLLRIGVKFMNSYSTVYTTRLHGAILGIMLNKEVKIFDNAYQKNSAFYEAWLKDMEKVDLH